MSNPVIRGTLGAYTNTPYAEYVTFIARKSNRGTKDQPNWVTIENPYMQVDGRVKEAQDEHASAGKLLHILTELVSDDETRVVFKCIVTSEIHGSATGWSVARRGGDNVESNNPYEVAETSAVGRALGLMGYGLIPMAGISSADEIKSKQAESQPTEKKSIQTSPNARQSWAASSALITRISENIGYYGKVRPHIINSLVKLGNEHVIKLEMTDDEVFAIVEQHAKAEADQKAEKK